MKAAVCFDKADNSKETSMLHAERQAKMTWEGNREVRGKVPGLDAAAFKRAARQAEQLCPVSNALRNNVAIHLNARLKP